MIIDASVVIKWFTNEPERKAALQIRDLWIDGEIPLSAPTLLYYEIVNTLSLRIHAPEPIIRNAISMVGLIHIQELTPGEYLHAANLVQKYGISCYDASYVVLAEKLECDLITADIKLVNKVKNLKFVKRLQHE